MLIFVWQLRPGYEPDPAIVAEAKRVARETRGKIEIMRSAEDAVAGAQAIYTDVWASMGQEEESAAREVAFAAYQVNEVADCRKRHRMLLSCTVCRRIEDRK